tara:strand:+ start:2556 stop:4337 length:1782 start_codon:yes stop_codon:yes gene_type:complete
MCGITGILDFKKKIKDPLLLINKLNELNKSRGPDDRGTWSNNDKNIFFGHTRLSVIDLTKNGKQPFLSYDKKISLIFNGEIYNFKDLKKILIQKNYIFASNTDTEVILHSYLEWGIDFIDKLRGMFSIAIWDENLKKLFLIRDQFGIKPLYYSADSNFFCFSSSIKSLINSKLVSNKRSSKSLTNYLLWGNTKDPDTIYDKIKSVEKGTYVVVDQNNNFFIKRYSDLIENIQNIEGYNFSNKDEAKSYLKEIIHETVNYHLNSDANLGLALSSGLDSNLILDNIKPEFNEKIKTLTVDFNIDGTIKDEIEIAKKFSLEKKIFHKVVNLDQLNIKQELKYFFNEMDTPSNDGFNTYILSKLAKDNNVKVLLTGIGADEIFMGYPSFNRAKKYLNILKLISKFNYKKMPKKTVAYFVKKFNFNPKNSEIFDIKSLLDLFLLSRRLFLDDEVKEILYEYQQDIDNNRLPPLTVHQDFYKLETNQQLMYLEIEHYLCPKLLKDSDWASMANSVELRTPFVDWEFFKKYLKLFKSNVTVDKKFIYETFKNSLPKELENRKKSGFGIPHNYLLKEIGHKTYSKNGLKDWSLVSLKNYFN